MESDGSGRRGAEDKCADHDAGPTHRARGPTFDVEVTIPADASAGKDYALRFGTRWYPTDVRGAKPAPVLVLQIVVTAP